jgi:hypothetical protein
MDRESISMFFEEGATANDIRKPGTVVKNPTTIVQLVVNGNESGYYGEHGGLDGSQIDFLIHRIYDVTLSKKNNFYENNSVKARVYTQDDDGVKERVFTVDGDGNWSQSN